ncbi:hypothetical protein ACFQ60_39670 [Streptomyces zhihengii]
MVEVRPLNGVLDDRAAAEHVQRALRDEEKRFSDPDRQSMMRAVVYRRAPELFSLLLIFDHIAVDERSKAMLQEELALLYQGDGHKLGPAVPYDPARIRGDFPPAREVPVLLAALDPLPPRVLPSPDPVADPAAFRAGSHEFDLLGDRRHEIDGLVRRLRCTRFELLLASFFRAMKQFADEDDILVVAPADTRGTVEDFETVGFFQNLVPLRSRTPPTRTRGGWSTTASRPSERPWDTATTRSPSSPRSSATPRSPPRAATRSGRSSSSPPPCRWTRTGHWRAWRWPTSRSI